MEIILSYIDFSNGCVIPIRIYRTIIMINQFVKCYALNNSYIPFILNVFKCNLYMKLYLIFTVLFSFLSSNIVPKLIVLGKL